MKRTYVCVLVVLLFFSSTPSFLWGNNSFQIPKDTVLLPWTPLKVSSENNNITVSCWGRMYVFDHSILPSQIVAKETSLLHKSANINFIKNNEQITKSSVDLRIVNKSDAVVEIEGIAVYSATSGKIKIKSKVHIEYDGLILISLTVDYPKNGEGYDLRMDIPFNKDNAKYYMKWVRNYHKKYSGNIAKGKGKVLSSKYTPYFWIGDNYKGLFWFCETTAYWPYANTDKAIQVIRKKDYTVQRFNIGHIEQYEFGLQGTPVKPFPENWRERRLMTSSGIRRQLDKADNNEMKLINGSNYVIHFPNPGHYKSVKYYGFPEAVNEKAYGKMIKRLYDKGYKYIPYGAITRIDQDIPNKLLNKKKLISGDHRMKFKNETQIYIRPDSKGYADFIANKFAHYLKAYDLDGYYLDGTKLLPYWKDSLNRSFYPILAYRELQRKLYASIKKINSNAFIIVHMSGNMNIPVLAYTDAYLEGEQFRYRKNGELAYKAQESYLTVISLARFRIEFMGKQWGVVPYFLPQVAPKDRDEIQPTLSLATLLLLHDVMPRPVASNVKIWNKMFRQLDEFGYVNSTFVPYYASIPPARTKTKGVYVSAYKKDNGQTLLIVGNLSKNSKSPKINLNLNKLGLQSIGKIINLTDNTEIHYSGDEIILSLNRMSYKLLRIE